MKKSFSARRKYLLEKFLKTAKENNKIFYAKIDAVPQNSDVLSFLKQIDKFEDYSRKQILRVSLLR